MKAYIIIACIIVLGFGCKDVFDSKTLDTSPTGKVLTEKDQAILKEAAAKFIRSDRSRSSQSREPFMFIDEIKSFAATSIPCYHLDYDKYQENPGPEGLRECLSLAESEIWYVFKKEGKIQILFNVEKPEEKWELSNFYLECETPFGWLSTRLPEVDSVGYGFIKVYDLYYFMYKKDGVPTYCRMTGEVIPEESFCQILLNKMNFTNEHRRRLKENKDLILDINDL